MPSYFFQANSIKFAHFKSETAQKIQRLSNRFWFTGIVFGLLNGIIKVSRRGFIMVFTNVVNQLDASYTQRVVRFEKSQVYW